jgi:hypothetical protein
MNIEVGVSARFRVTLDKATLEALIFESQHHYDALCRSYSADPETPSNYPDVGLLTRWHRVFTNGFLDKGETEWGFTATFHNLDVIAKICEMAYGKPLVDQFAKAICHSMHYWNANADKFPKGTITFGTTPLASESEV